MRRRRPGTADGRLSRISSLRTRAEHTSQCGRKSLRWNRHMAAQAGQIWGGESAVQSKAEGSNPGIHFCVGRPCTLHRGVKSSNQLSGWYGGWLEVAVCVELASYSCSVELNLFCSVCVCDYVPASRRLWLFGPPPDHLPVAPLAPIQRYLSHAPTYDAPE